VNLAFMSHVSLARVPFGIKITIALAFAIAELILLYNFESKCSLIVTQNNEKKKKKVNA